MEKDNKIILIVVAVVMIVLAIVFIVMNPNLFKSATGNTQAITVYQDIDFGGSAQTYGIGSYALAQMQEKGTENDYISSVKVAKGYTVTLYQDDNFLGDSIKMSEDNANFVSIGWNDRVSSMVISKNP